MPCNFSVCHDIQTKKLNTDMKKLTTILAVMLLSLCTWAASPKNHQITPSRTYTTKTFDFKGFTAIASNSIIDVEYTQSPGFTKVEVSAPENLMQYVRLNVDNGTLNINFESFSGKNFSGSYKIIAKISAPSVNVFTTNGTGDITLRNALNASKDIKLTTNGTGDITGPTVVCGYLETSVNGTGDIEIVSATCSTINANLSGTGDIEMKSLKSTDTKLSLHGTGDIEIKTVSTKSLNANLSGTGDIDLLGGTAENAIYVLTGTGDINAKNLSAREVNATNHSTGDIECHATESLTVKSNSVGSVHYKGTPRKVDIINGRGIKRIK